MSRKKLLIASLVVIVLILIASPFLFNSNDAEAIEVQTAIVSRQKVVQTVNATGRIQPKTQVNISADVSAKIMRLGVNEGDWVEKGDFLVELDGERHRAAVESAEANLRSIQAGATLARENMNKAEKDFVRTHHLFEQNLESQAVLDAVKAAHEVEKARYESSLQLVEQARAALKQARDDLSKTRIFAPMNGTVSQLNKEVGEIALGSQFQEDVVMVISNMSGMEALVDVDENDIVSVTIGDSSKIEVDALPGIVFTGRVSEIANSAKITGQGSSDQKTDFEVKIAIDRMDEGATVSGGQVVNNSEVQLTANSPGQELRPGMTASGDIVTETRANTIAVPIQCVAVRTPEQLIKTPAAGNSGEVIANEQDAAEFTPDRDGFVSLVFIIKDGVAEARQVLTGIQSDNYIEILDGISEGEEVVTGNYRAISKDLQNGSQVSVKNDPNGGERT